MKLRSVAYALLALPLIAVSIQATAGNYGSKFQTKPFYYRSSAPMTASNIFTTRNNRLTLSSNVAKKTPVGDCYINDRCTGAQRAAGFRKSKATCIELGGESWKQYNPVPPRGTACKDL